MTYQHLFLTMCYSVWLLHVFVYKCQLFECKRKHIAALQNNILLAQLLISHNILILSIKAHIYNYNQNIRHCPISVYCSAILLIEHVDSSHIQEITHMWRLAKSLNQSCNILMCQSVLVLQCKSSFNNFRTYIIISPGNKS
jgi:hypothetical protein